MFLSFTINKRGFWAICAAFFAGMLLGFVKLSFPQAQTMTGAQAAEGIPVPVVMYHSVLKDESRLGKYVISPSELESDLQYLQNHGYTAVTVRTLIGYVNGENDLPEKPIMLTFDDGYYNNYLYAYPLAEKYDTKLVISPIGCETDRFSETGEENGNYSHLTWDRIREMQQSGLVEFQNHSYNMHKSDSGSRMGTKKMDGEDLQTYTKVLSEDLRTMQRKMTENTGYTPDAFVYPFGLISSPEPEIVKDLGFQCTLTCEERMNYLTRDPEDLFDMGRYLRPSGEKSETFFERIGVK